MLQLHLRASHGTGLRAFRRHAMRLKVRLRRAFQYLMRPHRLAYVPVNDDQELTRLKPILVLQSLIPGDA